MNEKRARGTGRIFVRGAWIWIQYYDRRGAQVRESTKIPVGDDEKSQAANWRRAEKQLRKQLGLAEAGIERASRSFGYEDMRQLLYRDYQANQRGSLRFDAEDGAPRLDSVRRLDTYFEGFRASDIDYDSILDFMEKQIAEELSPASVNRSLAALRRMFTLAVKARKIQNAPPFPERLDESTAVRQGFIESKDYDTLAAALPDYLRLPFAIGFFGGLRRGEVVNLLWENVDFLGDKIRLSPSQTKNRTARAVPIVPALKTLLQQQYARRIADFPYVCFRVERGEAVRLGDFRKAWAKAVKAAGFPNLLFHDLRRSCVRSLVRSGVSRSVAREISGHKSESVFERYNITSEADIRDAAEKMSRFHSAVPQNGDKTGTNGRKEAAYQ